MIKIIQYIPQRDKKMKYVEERLKVQGDGMRKINIC